MLRVQATRKLKRMGTTREEGRTNARNILYIKQTFLQ